MRFTDALLCYSAAFGRVTWYKAELTSLAKCILQGSELFQARLTMTKRYNVTTVNCWDTDVPYCRQAAAEGCPDPYVIGCCMYRTRSRFIKEKLGMTEVRDCVICFETGWVLTVGGC
jgi:hypothetical protein